MKDRYLIVAWFVLTQNYHVFNKANLGYTLEVAKAIVEEMKKDTSYINVTLCKIEKDNHE